MMYLLESLKAHHAECLLAFSEYHHRSLAHEYQKRDQGLRRDFDAWKWRDSAPESLTHSVLCLDKLLHLCACFPSAE